MFRKQTDWQRLLHVFQGKRMNSSIFARIPALNMREICDHSIQRFSFKLTSSKKHLWCRNIHAHTNSPMPLKTTWKRGTIGRSTKQSSWLERASLTILYPKIYTILSLPLLRLNTGPYFSESCIHKQIWNASQTSEDMLRILYSSFLMCFVLRNSLMFCWKLK